MYWENLNYSGFANINDFKSKIWQSIYSDMKKYQDYFLSKESLFRSKDYIWPSDALNNWSRLWEYPYVHFHLTKIREQNIGCDNILDVGSGVTFFTNYLSKNGFKITATDIDPIAEKDNQKAFEIFKEDSINAKFQLCSEEKIPLENDSFDIVTSISVIEHVKDFQANISEISRVLKEKGFFILTLDIDLDGKYELSPESYDNLMNIIFQYFELYVPEKNFHPNSYLNNTNSPNPYPNFSGVAKFSKSTINFIKSIFGIKYFQYSHLNVKGMILRKK